MSASTTKSTNSDLAESHEEHTTEPKRWYRSSMFNACVIGMVGFIDQSPHGVSLFKSTYRNAECYPDEQAFPLTAPAYSFGNFLVWDSTRGLRRGRSWAPGLWNAMNSLGAGGELDFGLYDFLLLIEALGAQKPFLINAANALVFGLMGFFCLFGGPIANRIGLKWTLVLGAVGYPVYSAGLYTNNRYGNVWFVLVGAVACGVSAGLFWASEGAVALGYPPPGKRGQYMNIWLVFRTGGPILGGAILLGLNQYVLFERYKRAISAKLTSYPAPLIRKPKAKWAIVQRSDGSKVKIVQEKSFAAEMRALIAASKRRDILLLLPVFWAAYFNQYSGNFQTYYFGLRARCLIGFLTNFSGIISSFLVSTLLDYKPWPVKKRLNVCFFYVLFWHLLAWSYGWAIQEKYTRNEPVWDWTDPGFVEGFFVLVFWGFAQQSLQNFLYYFLSTKTDNISELSRFSGILRGQESFSQAVSFGINTKDWKGGRVPLAVNTILLGLAVVPTWIALQEHVPVEGAKKFVDVSELVEGVATEEDKKKFAVRQTATEV
ncbi:MFS general substrate transporter [Aureobasidium sp. EXF-3400]|nr:MFS general substrate transporter [Aureobasidium sp. EXF-12344]KAI4775145.1 MFS general substrate transporter [Aureobasidium sp. EXF-3400]